MKDEVSTHRRLVGAVDKYLAFEGGEEDSGMSNMAVVSACAAIVSAAAACATLYVFYHQNNERDRLQSAQRVCETFFTNSVIQESTESIHASNRQYDPIAKVVRSKPLVKATVRGANEQAEEALAFEEDRLEFSITNWANFLDVVARGLDEELYDEATIRSCLGPIIATAYPSVLGPVGDGKAIVTAEGYERLTYWSCRFKSEAEVKKVSSCAAMLVAG